MKILVTGGAASSVRIWWIGYSISDMRWSSLTTWRPDTDTTSIRGQDSTKRPSWIRRSVKFFRSRNPILSTTMRHKTMSADPTAIRFLTPQHNIIGSIRLIQCSIEYGVQKVIYASSGGTVYGEPTISLLMKRTPSLRFPPMESANIR